MQTIKLFDVNDPLFMSAPILSNEDNDKKSIQSDEEPQIISKPIKSIEVEEQETTSKPNKKAEEPQKASEPFKSIEADAPKTTLEPIKNIEASEPQTSSLVI